MDKATKEVFELDKETREFFELESVQAMLQGIRDTIPKNAVKMCNKCARRSSGAKCEVYPNRIPNDVLAWRTPCGEFKPKEIQREENMDNFVPKNAAVQCGLCKNHIPYTITCTAYPERIPDEILDGDKTCEYRIKQ